MNTQRKNRWASKEECRRYLETHKPTGLRRCAALDYLNGGSKKEAGKVAEQTQDNGSGSAADHN